MNHKLLYLITAPIFFLPLLSEAVLPSYSDIKYQIIGISDSNLAKIPVSAVNFNLTDSDRDGLDNDLEKALGTDPAKVDSDHDGYSDKTEIINNYNPIGPGKLVINSDLGRKLSGKFLLQVENKGQLWYVDPANNKRLYIGNEQRYQLIAKPSLPANPATSTNQDPLIGLANAIRNRELAAASNFFTAPLRNSAYYSLSQLDDDGRLAFANIISSLTISTASDSQKNYATEVYFELGGKYNKVELTTTRQADGTWLISKL